MAERLARSRRRKYKLTFRIWTAGSDRCDGNGGFGLGAGCDGDFGVFGVEERGEGCADAGGGAGCDGDAAVKGEKEEMKEAMNVGRGRESWEFWVPIRAIGVMRVGERARVGGNGQRARGILPRT